VDPKEYKNLAQDPRFARVVEEMEGLLTAGPSRALVGPGPVGDLR
jgi:hypothetical protein